MLRVKAKELSTDPEFKASLGCYSNWKRRHSISMRTKTSLAQCLPADMEDKVVEFHRFVLRSRQRWGYDLSRILNMDKTPMRFELPATRTLEFTGSRTVPVLSCGADKQSFTVALTVKANGEKLPPKVIFKGVRQLNINTPPRMQISVHKKGWMDEEGMFYLHTVCSEKKLFVWATNTILRIRNEVRTIVLLLWISCYRARAVKHVRKFFQLFAFLGLSFRSRLVKVSKRHYSFSIQRNKGVDKA